MADLEAKLEDWQDICVICKVKGWDGTGHEWQDCKRDKTGVWVECLSDIVKRVEKRIRFERYSGCFHCGLPQSICNIWTEDVRGGAGRFKRGVGGEHQFKGVLGDALGDAVCAMM